MAKRVSLGDLITEVTTQLRHAADAGEGSEKVMRFQECVLETAISVETQAGGGVNVWAVDLGARRRRSDSNTVRVRFTNLPERPIVLPVATTPPAPGGEPSPR